MTSDDMEMVGRLGEVDPLPTEALEQAEMVLRAAMVTAQVNEPARIGPYRHPIKWARLRDLAAQEQLDEPIGQWNGHARNSRRRVLTGIAAAALVVVGAGGAFLAAGTGSPASRLDRHQVSADTTPTVPLTGGTIQLADVSIPLPAGFGPAYSPCAPTPSGLVAAVSGFNLTAAAASSTGGCIDVVTASSASQPPAGSEPVTLSGFRASVTTDQSTGVTSLYVTISSGLDLVVTAEGLSANEIEATVGGPLPNLARQLVALEQLAAKTAAGG